MILAAVRRMDEIGPEEWTEIHARMEADTADRLSAALSRRKGLLLAAGRDLAKRLAASGSGLRAEDVRLGHEPSGRPYLVIREAEGFRRSALSVTLSHSDPWLLAAVSGEGVACDIQTVRHFPPEALGGFFTGEDLQYIRSAADPDDTLCMLWCRRECIIKLLGREAYDRQVSLNDTEALRGQYGVGFHEEARSGARLALAWAEQSGKPHPIDWRTI